MNLSVENAQTTRQPRTANVVKVSVKNALKIQLLNSGHAGKIAERVMGMEQKQNQKIDVFFARHTILEKFHFTARDL